MTSAGEGGGQMPCDGAWPDGDVDKLQQWINAGKPA
jgi:hypothetical protein